MPVNLVHQWLHRVEKGWDPISPAFAHRYHAMTAGQVDIGLTNRLAALTGGLSGKRVLDLGGGPGQYSVSLAQLGAEVTWHDPSREYLKIAQAKAQEHRVSVEFSLGYLEEAQKFKTNPFDLVFCRVCWYYCRGDRQFARIFYELVKPGGIGYIECNISSTDRRFFRRAQVWMNRRLWLKIGHPFPPRGRIARLFHRYPLAFMEVDYRSPEKDFVIFKKPLAEGQCGGANEELGGDTN